MSDNRFDVLLYGGYGYGNFGDDALMVAAYSVLRGLLPQRDIGISYAGKGDYLSGLVPRAKTVRRDAPGEITASLLIYGGGTQWYSFPGRPPARTPYKRLRGLAGEAKRALLRAVAGAKARPAVPVPPAPFLGDLAIVADTAAALGVGLGPFMCGGTDKAIRQLSPCRFVAVRDAASLDHCEALGLRNVRLGTDLCFLSEHWCGSDLPGRQAERQSTRRICVIVRDWPHSKEGSAYLGPLVRAVRALRKGGMAITYCAFSDDCDRESLGLLAKMNEDVLVWNPRRFGSLTEFAARLATFDLVVSARYHGLVVSSVLGIPGIAIEVEPKLAQAAKSLSCGYDLWPQPFDPKMLADAVDQAFRSLAQRQSQVADGVRKNRSLALDMVEAFRDSVTN